MDKPYITMLIVVISIIFFGLIIRIDSEIKHDLAKYSLFQLQKYDSINSFLSKKLVYKSKILNLNIQGVNFPNPVGLAAGFDKNCELLKILPNLGFGFIECGTITKLAQSGNEKPRLFKLSSEQAIRNKMGFNNIGSHNVALMLKDDNNYSSWISLGKNKNTRLELSANDYVDSFTTLFEFANFFVINISSPNTPRLRELQGNVEPILSKLQKVNEKLSTLHNVKKKNFFIKISPDLSNEQIDYIAQKAIEYGIYGIIATNTTNKLHGDSIEGGISGKPLQKKSNEVLRYLYEFYGDKLLLVGVGGIFSGADAYEKIKNGATLVQVYTGWIYGGAKSIYNINMELEHLLRKDGFANMSEAIGANFYIKS